LKDDRAIRRRDVLRGRRQRRPAGDQRLIRTSKEFDGVLDFDAAFRDAAKLTQMKEAFQSGDHLHGSDAGYRAVADSIDLELFR
jgi:hypothetical protein